MTFAHSESVFLTVSLAILAVTIFIILIYVLFMSIRGDLRKKDSLKLNKTDYTPAQKLQQLRTAERHKLRKEFDEERRKKFNQFNLLKLIDAALLDQVGINQEGESICFFTLTLEFTNNLSRPVISIFAAAQIDYSCADDQYGQCYFRIELLSFDTPVAPGESVQFTVTSALAQKDKYFNYFLMEKNFIEARISFNRAQIRHSETAATIL